MLNQKRQTIELGGHGNSPSNHFLRLKSGVLSTSSQSINVISRQAVKSPNKISNNVYPNKQNLPPQLWRQNSGLQNSKNFAQLQNSKVSVFKTLDRKVLFQERSNSMSPKNKGININYSTGVTPSHSKNSSIHYQETVSPSKIVVSQQRTQYEVELQRKLKILELRISQVHRQKQQIAAKWNQENRKIYHQNTSLKQKINQLLKSAQKFQKFQHIASQQRSQASSAETFIYQNSHLQIANLKREIIQLQQFLAEKGSLQNELIEKNKILAANLSKNTFLCESLKKELQRLNDLLTKKSTELGQIQIINENLKMKMQHYQRNKSAQDMQLENIRQLSAQNEERYKLILKEYQSKIEEYQNAYNSNQELIHNLEFQLQNQQNIAQSTIEEEIIQDSAVHNLLTSQCQELEDNLLTTIQEKDTVIENLNSLTRELTHELQQRQQLLKELTEADAQKTHKLLSASQLLDKVTQKFEELSQRYKELSQKYELQKKILTKNELVPEKCKKCQQLLRTVLRLNSHLNPKKT